jgi:hypothetical protein
MNKVAIAIPSFSARLPQILLYALHPQLIGLMAILAVVRAGANVLPNLLGITVSLMVWVMVVKTASEALENTARGRIDPGQSNLSMTSDSDARDLLILLFFFSMLPLVVLIYVGPWSGLLLLTALTCALPAAVAILVMDKSLPHALNPISWLALIARLGIDYVTAVAILLALQIGSAIVTIAANAWLPNWLAAMLGFILLQYVMVVGCHLIGYLIYQRHEDLGLDISAAAPLPALASSQEDLTLRDANDLAGEGKTAEATGLLQALMRERGAGPAVHERYRKLLNELKDSVRLSAHAREYIAVLLGAGNDKRALALAAEAVATDPEFRLHDADDTTRLVALAADAGHSQTALRLAVDFHQRFPKSKDAARNYLTVARLLAEKLGKEAQAKALLAQLIERYPGDPLIDKIRAYAIEVDALLAISSRAISGTAQS